MKLKDSIYGKGVGVSKKVAKLWAAKKTLEMLIPELNGKAEEICGINLKKSLNSECLMDSNNVSLKRKVSRPFWNPSSHFVLFVVDF